MMGVYPLNETVAISHSRDKLCSLQLLSRKGTAHKPDAIDDLISIVGIAPLLIKLVEDFQGIGVVLAETKKLQKA